MLDATTLFYAGFYFAWGCIAAAVIAQAVAFFVGFLLGLLGLRSS